MTTSIQQTKQNNPLYAKMCERFQIQGVSVAEIMLKKAERNHGHKMQVVKPAAEKKILNFHFTPSFVRHASICCSILLLVSVLMLCAIFGTSANSEFSKATGVFADSAMAEATPADNESVEMLIYTADSGEFSAQAKGAQ